MSTQPSNQQQSEKRKVVSIGVPIYKRLEYLPGVLSMIDSQDYPAIELIVSDNGQNGTRVSDMVKARYSRPYRFRQNQLTVEVGEHSNQILAEATGEYFCLLCDDDEFSLNFVSELAQLLDRNPKASLAYSSMEIVDEAGAVLRKSKDNLPDKLTGSEFIRAIWQRYEFGFENIENFITRTELWQRTGGYPNFPRGNHTDNAAVVRLCLGHEVVFSPKCSYRKRVHEGGYGWQAGINELAEASRLFLKFLDADPTIRQFAESQPGEWRELRAVLLRMTWETYLWRWRDLYRSKLSGPQWARAAFALPWIPPYYRNVATVFKNAARTRVKGWFVTPSDKRRDFFRDAH